MLKLNLEKELLKENRKINTPVELLKLQESDRLGAENISRLECVFPNMSAKEGGDVKNRRKESLNQANRFKQQRVFHISQIQSICEKYMLRFLSTFFYAGTIDPGLTKAVTEFELDYGVKLESSRHDMAGNSFIIAPASSFKLEKEPKDPLLFYKINSEYYYLIHKWGDDLNITRRIRSLFATIISKPAVIFFSMIACFIPMHLYFWMCIFKDGHNDGGVVVRAALLTIGTIISIASTLINWACDELGFKRKAYNSTLL